MSLALEFLFVFAGLFLPQQASDLSADGLVEEAWRLIPQYDGEHRFSLGEEAGRRNLAAVHLLQAATVLEPDHVFGLWSLGHASHLAAIDLKARSRDAEALNLLQVAETALLHGRELQPTDPWGVYELAQVYGALGRTDQALPLLDVAVENAKSKLEQEGQSTALQTMRFKALEWRCEFLMRGRHGDQARERLASFHAEFSTNNWPLHIANAESFEREWNLAAAAQEYEQIILVFPEDPQALAAQGSVCGLLGDLDGATKKLARAIQVELEAGLYSRLWLWILATENARPGARSELEDFMQGPPPSVTDWDKHLGHFMLGELSQEKFLAAADTEVARRLEAGQDLDLLMCEVHFYAGLRQMLEGSRLERAAAEFRNALATVPQKWKWEWAYARHFLVQLVREKSIEAPGAAVIEASYPRDAVAQGELINLSWHIPGESGPRKDLGREPEFGDLLMATRVTPAGAHLPVTQIIGVSAPQQVSEQR